MMATKDKIIPKRVWIDKDHFDSEGKQYEDTRVHVRIYTHCEDMCYPEGHHEFINREEHQAILSAEMKKVNKEAFLDAADFVLSQAYINPEHSKELIERFNYLANKPFEETAVESVSADSTMVDSGFDAPVPADRFRPKDGIGWCDRGVDDDPSKDSWREKPEGSKC